MGSFEGLCDMCDEKKWIRLECKCGVCICEDCRDDYCVEEMCYRCNEDEKTKKEEAPEKTT